MTSFSEHDELCNEVNDEAAIENEFHPNNEEWYTFSDDSEEDYIKEPGETLQNTSFDTFDTFATIFEDYDSEENPDEFIPIAFPYVERRNRQEILAHLAEDSFAAKHPHRSATRRNIREQHGKRAAKNWSKRKLRGMKNEAVYVSAEMRRAVAEENVNCKALKMQIPSAKAHLEEVERQLLDLQTMPSKEQPSSSELADKIHMHNIAVEHAKKDLEGKQRSLELLLRNPFNTKSVWDSWNNGFEATCDHSERKHRNSKAKRSTHKRCQRKRFRHEQRMTNRNAIIGHLVACEQNYFSYLDWLHRDHENEIRELEEADWRNQFFAHEEAEMMELEDRYYVERNYPAATKTHGWDEIYERPDPAYDDLQTIKTEEGVIYAMDP